MPLKKFGTKCDKCFCNKNPIVYITLKRKLCVSCWQAEKNTAKSVIEKLPWAVEWDPPFGYHFIANEWFIDQKKGKKYADFIYQYMKTAAA